MFPVTPTLTATTIFTSTPGVGINGGSVLARLDPWMITLIILATLAALMVSLWMVYLYISNIRTTEIHHTMLWDAVFESRLRNLGEQAGAYSTGWGESPDELEQEREQKLSQQANQKARLKELNSRSELSEAETLERANLDAGVAYADSELAGRLSEKTIQDAKARQQQFVKDQEERQNKIKEQAKKDADTWVPPTLTVAGMGITGSFFIELTAILTIIFGIIILGFVGVLGTAEIAPILAAIAGYVLGKTTQGWAPYGGTAWLQQSSPPQASALPRTETETTPKPPE